jgi:epoxyqueuosine reductase QueG
MIISKKSNKKENNKILIGVRAYGCDDCCKSKTSLYKAKQGQKQKQKQKQKQEQNK